MVTLLTILVHHTHTHPHINTHTKKKKKKKVRGVTFHVYFIDMKKHICILKGQDEVKFTKNAKKK